MRYLDLRFTDPATVGELVRYLSALDPDLPLVMDPSAGRGHGQVMRIEASVSSRTLTDERGRHYDTLAAELRFHP